MRKIISIFSVSLLLILSIFCLASCIDLGNFNTVDSNPQGLDFYLKDDGTYAVGVGNAMYLSHIEIPEEYNGRPVTEIADYGFANGVNGHENKNLKTIIIPDSITKIGKSAFDNCSTLESIVIPDSVTSIGDCAFKYCSSLTSISISNNVKVFPEGLLKGCNNLQEISMPCYNDTPKFEYLFKNSDDYYSSSIPPIHTINITGGNAIPDGMFDVGWNAKDNFQATLKTLTMADSIKSIGDRALYSCPDYFFEEEDNYIYFGKWVVGCKSHGGKLRSDTIGIATSALVAKDYVYDENVTEFVVPASIKYLSPMSLIYSPYITTYTVEEGNEFYCSVDGVVYSKDMKKLIQHPIEKSYNQDAFIIPDGVTSIYGGAFYLCSGITSVVIPDSVTSIGRGAFYDCENLKSVVLSDSLTSIARHAFGACDSLESIVIPDGVTVIGRYAFHGCDSLESVVIPDSVTSIGRYAFCQCDSLKSVVIPHGITSIARYAFSGCDSLESVVIPDSVTVIGREAFDDCYSIKDVYFTGAEETWSKIDIGGYNSYIKNATKHYNYIPEN